MQQCHNRSRQQINDAVRAELLRTGALAEVGQTLSTLAHRSDMTGADRTWAARYAVGNVLQYTPGSKTEGIERDSFATVQSVDARANTLTVELDNGASVTYDPRRLRGVNVHQEALREFATGDRIQFTKSNWQQRIRFGDFAAVERIAEDNSIAVRLDS